MKNSQFFSWSAVKLLGKVHNSELNYNIKETLSFGDQITDS